ncbi:MAG: cytochrome C [Candidatus Bathyarchaeia archaeon]
MSIPKVKPWQAGLVVGLLAALAQAVYNVMPETIEGVAGYKRAPPAYGFCMFCHVRDFVNWFLVRLVPWMKPAPISVVIPVLTVIGVIVGASLTAIAAKEFSWKKTINPGLAATYGFLVVFFAGLLGACPVRITLRAAYFGVVGFVGVFSMILGTWVATEFVLKRP